MASRFKSVIASLAAVIVVATAAGTGDPAPEINRADGGNSKMHDKIAADTRAFRVGELERAIYDFDKAIQIDPDYASAYINGGHAYRQLGQDAEADADFTKACSLNFQFC